MIIAASTVGRDIIERKRLGEQLRRAHKMEAIGILAGGVAHEFNNILTVIMGFASLTKERTNPDHPVMPYIDQCLPRQRKLRGLPGVFSHTTVSN
jgi:two-component system, cell cycle sensor histidine kinase and response regulator CckA